jgi:hypothetical protein
VDVAQAGSQPPRLTYVTSSRSTAAPARRIGPSGQARLWPARSPGSRTLPTAKGSASNGRSDPSRSVKPRLATYTRGVGDDSARPACGLFGWWWLGGFCFAGKTIAVLALAAVLGSVAFLAFLGIAVLGAIVGLLVGFGIAQALVLIAEGLGWDEKRRSSRLGRLVQCLD